MTADTATACVNHPEITRRVLACRHCRANVCLDCREPRSLAGTGITIQVCTSCLRREVRAKRTRLVAIVAAVAIVLSVIAATSMGPVYALAPLLVSGAFLYFSWMRYRTGTANLFDALRVGSAASRFLR